MAINDLILVQKYNDIQKKVGSILGIGTGEYGYGQTLNSYPVVTTAIGTTATTAVLISATQWDNLRYDITSAYKHQTGQSPTITDINEGLSITWSHALQYDTLADTLVANKDQIYTGSTTGSYTAQASVVNGGSRSIGPGWGNNESNQRYVQQRYLISWDTSENARFFFNSGGYIRLIHSLVYSIGSPNSKTVGWNGIITAMNDIQFTFDKTNYREGLAGVKNIWFPSIPGRTDGQQHDSTNPYQENYGYQQFRWVDSKTIEVLVQLADDNSGNQQFSGTPLKAGVAGTVVDETIDATISSGLEYRTSIDQVIGGVPNYTIGSYIIAAAGGPLPPAATYSLSRSASSVNEGGNVSISLSTTNLTNGSSVPFTISGNGITAADFVGLSSLNGNFTVSGNAASINFVIAADALTEGSETFTLTLNNVVPPVSISVLINDTSISPPEDPG